MTETQGSRTGAGSWFEQLLRGELPHGGAHVAARLRRVLRLDGDVYAEIETDPNGIPAAFAVVIGSAVLAGIGQGVPVLVFLGVVWALLAWLLGSGLIWGVATIVLAREVDYSRLAAGLGHAYVWTALLLLARLPGYLGVLLSLAALGLCFAGFVQASEQALDVTRERALVICAVALVLPFVGLLVALV